MARAGKLAVSDCNFVHIDDSWKTYVRRERELSKKWAENWDFLPVQYQKLHEDISPCHEAISRHNTPTSTVPFHLPPLPCPPQNEHLSFPKTTAKEIGWRSQHKSRSLEIYGRWGRPKVSILHHLNWPNDAID